MPQGETENSKEQDFFFNIFSSQTLINKDVSINYIVCFTFKSVVIYKIEIGC